MPYAVAFSSGTAGAARGRVRGRRRAGRRAGDQRAHVRRERQLRRLPRRDADVRRHRARHLERQRGARSRRRSPSARGSSSPCTSPACRRRSPRSARRSGPTSRSSRTPRTPPARATPDGPVGACRHADMAVFSFHPVKTITTGRGRHGHHARPGAARPARRVPHARHSRRDAELERRSRGCGCSTTLGFNYRLTDVQSALGRSQLARLDAFVGAPQRDRRPLPRRARRRRRARARRPRRRPGSRHAYHLFVVRHRDGAGARRALYDAAARARHPRARCTTCPSTAIPGTRETYGYGAGPVPGGRALLRRLPVAAVLPGAVRRRAGPRDRRGARGGGRVTLPREFAIGGRHGRPRPPDVRDRRGGRQPQPRPRHRRGALIDVAADAGRRRGEVPDLLRRGALLDQDAALQVPRAGHRPLAGRAARGHLAAARVAARARRLRRASAASTFFSSPFDHDAVRELDALDVPGAQDRLVRDRRPAADPRRGGHRAAAADLDRDGGARRGRGRAERGRRGRRARRSG